MFDVFPPVFVFIIGAVLLPLLPKGSLRGIVTLFVPIISAWLIWNAPEGMHAKALIFGLDVTLMRVDKLSTVFGLIFSLAAFLSALYAWHVRDAMQQIATLIYAGTAIGAVFSGDFLSLFVYWEGTALASVFLIWARRTEGAYQTGMRYLIIQISSGVILIAGIALHFRGTGSIAFTSLTGDGPGTWQLGTWLIFIAFGIKCAFPLMHNWLRFLSRRDCNGYRNLVRLYDQDGRLLSGTRVSRHRDAGLYRRDYDVVSDLLCRNRK